MSWRSEKVIICALCGLEEIGNLDIDTSIICSQCVFRLYQTPSEKIKKAYDRLMAKGSYKRAELISGFIEGRDNERSKPITEKKRAHIRISRRRIADRVRFKRVVRFADQTSN